MVASLSSHLPPIVPRTPTPPSHHDSLHVNGGSVLDAALRRPSLAPSIQEDHDYDIKAGLTDSPERGPYMSRPTVSGGSFLSPASSTLSVPESLSSTDLHPGTMHNASLDDGLGGAASADANNEPFNFVSVQYTTGKGNVGKSEVLGKRRGHKYRHSSIHASHMESIVKPLPSLRTPLSVPASLPMPTRTEAWWSMTRDQTRRLAWCACHFFVAGYVQFSGSESLALTALSRLVLFDAAAATVCVVVDVMGNFEVWQRSSIKHPFGLERADVLAGFGMAVFIVFMGLDILSHGIQHSLENIGDHVAHVPHDHDRVLARNVDTASGLAVFSTLVSAFLLKNHGRIGKAMRFEMLDGWRKIFGNPSHFLTLSCSVLILLLPLLPERLYGVLDKLISFLMAVLMIALGVRLATSLASMLLMSFNPPSTEKDAVRNVIVEIANSDAAVTSVEEAKFWQVHYGLCMANLKLRYRSIRSGYGVSDDIVRIRQKVSDLIRRRFGGINWDISIQLAMEAD